MSTKKTIEKNILINAPKQKVWDTLFNDKTYRIWTESFIDGSYAETDWEVGSEIVFKGSKGYGMFGKIEEKLEPDFMCFKLEGLINSKGVKDSEGEEAKPYKDSRESYTLIETDGVTELDIVAVVSEEYFETMDKIWDEALLKVRELAEK